MFSLLESLQGFSPLLTTHVDYAQIGVSPTHMRVGRQNLTEVVFRLVELVLVQRDLAGLEKLPDVNGGRSGAWRPVSRFGGISEG